MLFVKKNKEVGRAASLTLFARVGLFAPSPSRFASLALGGSAAIPLATGLIDSLRRSNKFGLFVFICWGWAGASPAPTLGVYKTLIIIFFTFIKIRVL
jgi:hypothetical protein